MKTNFICVAASHEDFEIMAAIEAGIDDFDQLVVRLIGYNYSSSKIITVATVDKEDTATLARSLDSDITDLPDILYEEYEDIFLFLPSEVNAVYQDILEKILDHGVKYRLKE